MVNCVKYNEQVQKNNIECKGTLTDLSYTATLRQAISASGLFCLVCEGQAGNFVWVKKVGEYELFDTSNPLILSIIYA